MEPDELGWQAKETGNKTTQETRIKQADGTTRLCQLDIKQTISEL